MPSTVIARLLRKMRILSVEIEPAVIGVKQEIMRTVVQYLIGAARGLCVIAVGKLGGHEIGYASDLDLLFFYDPDAASNPDEARKVVEALDQPAGVDVTMVSEDMAESLDLPAGGRANPFSGVSDVRRGRMVEVRFRFPTADGQSGRLVSSEWLLVPSSRTTGG